MTNIENTILPAAALRDIFKQTLAPTIPTDPTTSLYRWTLLLGVVVSMVAWWRLAKTDRRLIPVYAGALAGAFTGAKLVYILAEGWLHIGHPDFWTQLATGKTITGALLGGYLGVEITKHLVGYTSPTGDRFAIIAPVAIAIGRVGCLTHGCCPGEPCDANRWYALTDAAGTSRWPAVPIELAFNIAFIPVALALTRARALPGQHFHLYLIAYGTFRFAHEFARATPKIIFGLSGYHIAALALTTLGICRFLSRRSTTN